MTGVRNSMDIAISTDMKSTADFEVSKDPCHEALNANREVDVSHTSRNVLSSSVVCFLKICLTICQNALSTKKYGVSSLEMQRGQVRKNLRILVRSNTVDHACARLRRWRS